MKLRSCFAALLCLTAVACAGEIEKQKLVELRKVADHTPLYPGFQKVRDYDAVMKQGRVSLQISYKSDAQFADVRKFYDAALAHDGWGPPEVPPRSIIVGELYYVTYHRGTYEITVARDEARHDVYVIAFVWYSE